MDSKEVMQAEGRKTKVQLVVAFILGLIVGILVAPTFFGHDGTTESTGTPTGGEKSQIAEATSTDAITVNDQLAGDRVLIKEITLDKSGWAVVHEDIEGAPGNALGAQRFDPGTFEDAHVDLLRNTESNDLYYVILYGDNGDGEFDIKTDTPLMRNGKMIYGTFTTVTIDRKNNM